MYSCQKIDLQDVVPFHITQDITYDLEAITMIENGDIYVAGGYVWDVGIIVRFDIQNTDSIHIDTISDKGLFDIALAENNTMYCVGADGYLFEKKDSLPWQFIRLSGWDILHNIFPIEDGLLLSGGKSYAKGYIYRLSNDLLVDSILYTDYEINDIVSNNKKILYPGFGTLSVASLEEPLALTKLKNIGDIYISGVFVDENTGYIIGANGQINQSVDGGLTWEPIKPDGLDNGFNIFKRIIRGAQNLAILGTDGRFWISNLEGKNWTSYQLNVNKNIHDALFVSDDTLLLVGEQGLLCTVKL